MDSLPCAKAHNLGSSAFPLKSLTLKLHKSFWAFTRSQSSLHFIYAVKLRPQAYFCLWKITRQWAGRRQRVGLVSLSGCQWKSAAAALAGLLSWSYRWCGLPSLTWSPLTPRHACVMLRQASPISIREGAGFQTPGNVVVATAATAEENAVSLSTNQVFSFSLRPQTAVLAFPWKRTPLCSWNAQKKHILMKTKMRG